MCGIAGILGHLANESRPESIERLKAMAGMLRHRGPDGFGYYHDAHVGLAHSRLSIIDIEGGGQPIHNEDRSVWISYNGEIFNYRELRAELEAKGHRFYTASDTEVIVHLYEEYGHACLDRLNGQFAFAIWDAKRRELFLARDRVGIRPLFYTTVGNSLIFASEIKALFVNPEVPREIDLRGLQQVLTFWATIPPRTAFQGILELPPGHFMVASEGRCETHKYWDVDFAGFDQQRNREEVAEEFRELLVDATRLRLRADVPVGAYLSGGIDSSTIAAIIRNHTETPLRTFSVTFADKGFDESRHQASMVDYLKTEHSTVHCDSGTIGAVFPDVVWHTEKPLVRTAPAPLYLLSRLVNDNGYKVVLTGEGADEILAGYDIFKEDKIRRFLARVPDSAMRPLILRRLYPYLENSPTRSLDYARKFFDSTNTAFDERFRSHAPRWDLTGKTQLFFADAVKTALAGYDNRDELDALVPRSTSGMDPLSRAQYVEIKTLLSGYLLCSQGDRMSMAHSVEGRFPFLDYRVIEYCAKIPPKYRMPALREKDVLKRSMRGHIPDSVRSRIKQPYRAPDASSFFGTEEPDYVKELLSPANLASSGYFNPGATEYLLAKCRKGRVVGFKDNMAVVGIVSTLLLHDQFVDNFHSKARELLKRNEDAEFEGIEVAD